MLPTSQSDKDIFLNRHGLTQAELSQAGLSWDLLNSICIHHNDRLGDLGSVADYFSSRLQTVSEVHSLKARVKDPEHLVAKLIRKKLEKQDVEYDTESYDQQITDLVGIRALHLFKNDWQPIHEFVTKEWELAEKPIAYIRKGDPKPLIEAFSQAGCEVKEHQFGYRSIHYLAKSQPAKRVCIAELQIRTIFEEGWSEIDHRVRYPRLSDDPYLADFLTIFNRLAGSSDEMGTFVRGLSSLIHQHASKVAEQEEQLLHLEDQLKSTISKLEISKKDKESLESQVSELRKKSQQQSDTNSYIGTQGAHSFNSLPTTAAYTNLLTTSPLFTTTNFLSKEKTCSKCGKLFEESILSMTLSNQGRCPECRRIGQFGISN